jgi:hypothetical protein
MFVVVRLFIWWLRACGEQRRFGSFRFSLPFCRAAAPSVVLCGARAHSFFSVLLAFNSFGPIVLGCCPHRFRDIQRAVNSLR